MLPHSHGNLNQWGNPFRSIRGPRPKSIGIVIGDLFHNKISGHDLSLLAAIACLTHPVLLVDNGSRRPASVLAMLDMVDAIEAGESFDPSVSKRKVLGIDIDIRDHNRAAIDAHPMRSRIEMIQEYCTHGAAPGVST